MLYELKEALKAWRRGERRIAPHPVRGRVYVKKNPTEQDEAARARPPGGQAVSRGVVQCEAKITRADGTVERVRLPDQEITRRL